MAHPPEQPVEKQARRHSPALIAIVIAIALAVIAFLIFGMSDPEDMTDEPTATTAAPDEQSAGEGEAPAPAQ